jgi:hypothetical protein
MDRLCNLTQAKEATEGNEQYNRRSIQKCSAYIPIICRRQNSQSKTKWAVKLECFGLTCKWPFGNKRFASTSKYRHKIKLLWRRKNIAKKFLSCGNRAATENWMKLFWNLLIILFHKVFFAPFWSFFHCVNLESGQAIWSMSWSKIVHVRGKVSLLFLARIQNAFLQLKTDS